MKLLRAYSALLLCCTATAACASRAGQTEEGSLTKKKAAENAESFQPDALSIALTDRINEYRVSHKLPRVARSRSLGIVADTHVHDLAKTQLGHANVCNLHSWSRNARWTECCYTPDHANASCMWKKPKELVGFDGAGFEVAAWSSGNIDPESAVKMWNESPGHKAVILNEGDWGRLEWKSVGAAIYQGYAVAWFAAEEDPSGGY